MYSAPKSSVKVATKRQMRRHEGVYQVGPRRGQLKKGFRYTGKVGADGLPEIVRAAK